MPDQGPKASDQFESELDEFFKERAQFRAIEPGDSSKSQSANMRDDGLEVLSKNIPDVSNDPNNHAMGGCCMTGCFDCPWGYRAENT